MKGASEIIALVVLLMISISVLTVGVIWYKTNSQQLFEKSSSDKGYLRSRACLSLDSVDVPTTTAVLRNCGAVELERLELKVDGVESTPSPTFPDTLKPGETFTFWSSSMGYGKSVFVTSDLTSTPSIKLELVPMIFDTPFVINAWCVPSCTSEPVWKDCANTDGGVAAVRQFCQYAGYGDVDPAGCRFKYTSLQRYRWSPSPASPYMTQGGAAGSGGGDTIDQIKCIP